MIINKDIIQEFARDVDETSFLNAYSVIFETINNAFDIIKKRNPYIINYEIFVANEAFSKTEFVSSTLDIFVVLNAVQIELNSYKKKNNKFVSSLKLFWKEFKDNLVLFRSKKKEKERYYKQIEKKSTQLNTYNVNMLYNDLMLQMSNFLYEKTKLEVQNNRIVIVGDEEFGININIYPVFNTSENTYKLYNIKNDKVVLIDFKERFVNYSKKEELTNGQFSQQVRIFNNLFWNCIKHSPNQIFIESLIYNCPNELFVDSLYLTTINLINYIKNSTMQTFLSICDENIIVFNEPLNTTSLQIALKFINNIDFVE